MVFRLCMGGICFCSDKMRSGRFKFFSLPFRESPHEHQPKFTKTRKPQMTLDSPRQSTLRKPKKTTKKKLQSARFAHPPPRAFRSSTMRHVGSCQNISLSNSTTKREMKSDQEKLEEATQVHPKTCYKPPTKTNFPH